MPIRFSGWRVISERAEDTARILDVNHHMLLEQSQEAYHLRWEPLMVMAEKRIFFHRLYSEVNAENVFEFLASSRQPQFHR